MKRENNIKLQWKIFFYMMVFALVIIIIIAAGFNIFMSTSYKNVSVSLCKESARNAFVLYKEGKIDEIDETIANEDFTVIISDISGSVLYRSETSRPWHTIPDSRISEYARLALLNNGEYLEYNDGKGIREDDDGKVDIGSDRPVGIDKKDASEVIYVLSETDDQGNDIIIIVMTHVIPFAKTTLAVNKIVIIGALVTIIVGIIISVIFSNVISAPIRRITAKSKELGQGKYDVVFDEGSFTEIRSLSDTLNQSARELEKTEKYREELIANVSHDLKTPLTLIGGYAQMMKDFPQEVTDENLDLIIKETERLNRLVNDMLDVSRFQADATQFNPTRIDLNNMIANALDSYYKLMNKTGVSIEFDSDRSKVYDVNADVKLLTQALYNLINNAVNYCGDDQKVIVKLVDMSDKIRVEVIDHGCGISDELLTHIWDRYYKDPSNHKRPEVGTGLGLSIVKKIFERHGFDYGVDSKIGEGSTFWFEADIAK